MNVRKHLGNPILSALLLLSPAALAGTLVIDGGTVHPVVGDPYVGRVVVKDGLIAAAGPDVSAPSGADRIDAAGLHVFPGMFDALSSLGLVEISAVPATNDQAEMGAYNPHLGATTAVHPASEVIPVTRANGVTHTLAAHAIPRGLLNAMIEIRNDLIADPAGQQAMAERLSRWVAVGS